MIIVNGLPDGSIILVNRAYFFFQKLVYSGARYFRGKQSRGGSRDKVVG